MKNFTLLLLFALIGLFGFNQSANAQAAACLSFAGGPYTDQAIDNAGCNGQSLSAPYEAWKNEVYFTNVVAGGNYTFSICTRYNATDWGGEALNTAIEGGTAATGTVTGGTVLGFEVGCSITFDATATGTVFFTLTVVGDCGGTVLQTDNGTPTITTNSGVSCGTPIDCTDPSVSSGTIAGGTSVCFNELTDLTVTGAVIPNASTNINGFCWFVANADLTGNTAPNTSTDYFGSFPIQALVPTAALGFNNNGASLPAGNYFFCASVFGNATNAAGGTPSYNTITLDPACTHTTCYAVTLLPDGDPSCTTCPVVNFSTTLECATQSFYVQADVTYVGATGNFNLNVNGSISTVIVAGPYSFGPFASGTTVSVTVSNGDVACDETTTYTEICPTVCERVTDGGFEEGGTAWTQASTNFGTPLCTAADCGTGGIGPYAGTRWSWFGGIDAAETSSLAQTVTITAPSATLSFYLAIAATAPNTTDFLKVKIGNTEVFTVSSSQITTYAAYTLVTVDISAFANGTAQLLTFESSVFAGGGTTSFHVDNISVEACGGICIADAGTMENVFVNGNNITALATGYTTTTGYTYLYFLVNAAGNIVANHPAGTFTITSGSPSDYSVYGVLSSDLELGTVLSVSTIADLQALITVIGICADITGELSVGIDSPNATSGFGITALAPVPTTDAVNIQFNALGTNIQANVFDMTGRLVATQSIGSTNGINNFRLDVSNYAAGIYLVSLTDGQYITTAKLVKN